MKNLNIPKKKRIKGVTKTAKMRENIEKFLVCLNDLGVPQREQFVVSDLYDEKNVRQVLICFDSLQRRELS